MISILIADDQDLIREGVKAILATAEDVTVIGEAVNGLEAVKMAVDLKPDIVLMDIKMPQLDGIEACERIVRLAPLIKILVLSQVDTVEHLVRLLQAGAIGYVLKENARHELVYAIRQAMQGHTYMTPRMTSCFVQHSLKNSGAGDARRNPDRITAREKEVLTGIAEGFTANEIAEKLSMSVKTVQAHRTHIMEKLDLHRSVDLVKYAIRTGLISQEISLPGGDDN